MVRGVGGVYKGAGALGEEDRMVGVGGGGGREGTWVGEVCGGGVGGRWACER